MSSTGAVYRPDLPSNSPLPRLRTRPDPATQHALQKTGLAVSKVSTRSIDIKNAVAKELVTAMKEAELSDKTIVNYVHVLQSVIASVVNAEGEQVHPRTWDSHF